jgi:hypothetical protein
VEGLRALKPNGDSASEDMHKDDDMDHDGPSNNSGDDLDRDVKRKKNEEDDKDTDYEPSLPSPSAGASLAASPTELAQENDNGPVYVSPRYDNVFFLQFVILVFHFLNVLILCLVLR